MIEIWGAHNTAVCYCAGLEKSAQEQIRALCDQEAFAGSKIRIMPDVHAGKGCTIGTTMTITDRVTPGMVGVDIGCGMETVRIREREIDFDALDALIRARIPSGRSVREDAHPFHTEIDLHALRCASAVQLDRAELSIGTLGGGNHFIEVDRGEDGALYLVIHSGSRHLGGETARHYQNRGYRALNGDDALQQAAIARLKADGRDAEIQQAVKAIKQRRAAQAPISRDMAYVEGALLDDYLHDMKIIQRFAALNRKAMVEEILSGLRLTPTEVFTTTHNYIDTDAMILRKGAVSARVGERLLIPINMRDGSLVCTGRGNADWNCSAPHGAGRLMGRREALAALSMEEYRAEMAGVYSTCVAPATLDESPMAYKSLEEIAAQIGPTAEIVQRIRPVYNYKAAE